MLGSPLLPGLQLQRGSASQAEPLSQLEDPGLYAPSRLSHLENTMSLSLFPTWMAKLLSYSSPDGEPTPKNKSSQVLKLVYSSQRTALYILKPLASFALSVQVQAVLL